MSLFDTDEAEPVPAPEREGGRVVWLVVIGLGLLVGGGYLAAYLTVGGKVPHGTAIAGVDVGALEHDAAVSTLEDGVADRLDQAIRVEVDHRSEQVDPQEAGLAIDYEASVENTGAESSWSPGRLWDYFTGGGDFDAVVSVDEDAMASAIDELEGKAGTPARNGRWIFPSGRPKEVDPRVGRGLDFEETEEALVAAYQGILAGDDSTAVLELIDLEPEIDADDMQQAREEFVNPAMSGPVTMLFDDFEVRLAPKDYVRALRLNPRDGVLVPAVNERGMKRVIDRVTAGRGKPVDATVRLVDGRPKVVKGRPAIKFDMDEAESAFLEAVVATGDDRTGKVDATLVKPDFATKDARALKIRRKISEFTTDYPHADYRNVNLGRAAEKINGTVLKPGDVFSLNDIVGERTAKNGFTEGYIISDGILKRDFGGGVSQMATTAFNAMFFAGLKDIEHKPHSFYIDRYPVGREATVAWPTLDLKFENDTPYGVLVEAFITPSSVSSQGSVTVRMYSTKYWDVSTKTGNRYNYVPPRTRTITTPDCEPFTGWAGFEINVWRYFKKHASDKVVKRERFHTSYLPADNVVCEEPESQPDQDDGDGDGGGNNGGGNNGGGNN